MKALLALPAAGLPLLILLLDLYKRLSNREAFFVGGAPAVGSYDGFLYARLARQIAEGVHHSVDCLRVFPGCVELPFPPLISSIYGHISKLTGVKVEWIDPLAVPVYVLLSSLVLFTLINRLSDPLTALFSSLTAHVSTPFLMRSYPGRFDTDALNLFFPSLILLLTFLSLKNGRKGFLLLAFTFPVGYAYYLWYPRFEILFLSFLPVLIVSFIDKRRDIFWGAFSSLILLWIAVSLTQGYPAGSFVIDRIHAYLRPPAYNLPDVRSTIQELRNVDFFDTWRYFFVSKTLIFFSLAGFFLFCLRRPRHALFLLPFIALTSLAVYTGYSRAYMYAGPLIGLGYGYLTVFLLGMLKGVIKAGSLRFLSFGVFPVLLIFTSLPLYKYYPIRPFVGLPVDIQRTLLHAADRVPERSVALAWWDMGYPTQYFTGAATFHDGGSQGTLRTNLIALAFLSDEERSYSILKVLSSPAAFFRAEDLIRNGTSLDSIDFSSLGGSIPPETYILLDRTLLLKTPSFRFLSGLKEGRDILMLPPCDLQKCTGRIDLQDRSYTDDREGITFVYRVRAVVEADEDGRVTKRTELDPSSDLFIVLRKKGDKIFRYLLPEDLMDSILVKLLLLTPSSTRFEKVYDGFPDLVIYKVRRV